jgi:hypothetical protein
MEEKTKEKWLGTTRSLFAASIGLVVLAGAGQATPPSRVVGANGTEHSANRHFISESNGKKIYVDLNSFKRDTIQNNSAAAQTAVVSAFAYVDTGKNHVLTELMALWFICSGHFDLG